MEYLKAFVCGGLLCAIAQVLIDKTNQTPARILVAYVVAGVILGGVGIYQPFADWAGAGATVPLTGFGNNLAKGVREAVIITLGEKGTVLVTRDTERYFPGIPMEAIDTGGAGDTFAGALLAALSRDWALEKAVCYAQCASALCVTRISGYSATDKAEVDALFAKVYPQYLS